MGLASILAIQGSRKLQISLIVITALLVSFLLTGLVRTLAVSHGLLDVPNDRSSHTVPTPRGGGVAIVAASLVAWLILALTGRLPVNTFIAIAGGGIAVAVVGLVDDRYRLSARIRLSMHFGAAIWALAWLGDLPPLQVGDHTVSLGWAGRVLEVLAIVWTLNLFNFMDGIDGIAGSEAAFITFAGAMLAAGTDMGGGVFAAAVVLGAACCGFLGWNWPPARIFMGDVGSGYLGYAIAVLALSAAREHPTALFAWLLLGGTFFVDATVTLVRRLVRGEQVNEAHRSHAYQWLARRWRSHRRVTVLFLLVNTLWLLPWALVAIRHPSLAAWSVGAAFLPLTAAALLAGAGRSEKPAG